MEARLAVVCVVMICCLLFVGCSSNPVECDQQETTIIGVWERVEDQHRWEFTEDDSLFLMSPTSRSYCVWDWGTYGVEADSIAMDVHDGSCIGNWMLSEGSDTLVLRLVAPCDSLAVLVRVSGPSHTDVPHCE